MVAPSIPLSQHQSSRLVSRSPIFYGWVIWLVAALTMMAAAPGFGLTISLFIDHYITEFDLTRTQVSIMLGIGGLIASFNLTWLGKQIDRRGNRQIGTLIALTFGVTSISLFWISGAVTLFLSFYMTRFLAGAMYLSGNTVVARWWSERRALVMSLAMMLDALFRWRYVPTLEALIAAYGWRATWVILGVTIGGLIFPLWWFFIRDAPEQFGLHPDGLTDEQVQAKARNQIIEPDWTLAQARQTAIFWVLLLGRALMGTLGAGLIVHQVSIFAQVGYSETDVAHIFGKVALVSGAAMLIVGWLMRRVRAGRMLAMQMALMIGALALATTMTKPWMLSIFIVVYGVVWGFGGTFDATVWADLFGRRHHGAIRGFSMTMLMVGTAIGPVLYGFSKDYFGNYTPVAIGGIILLSIELVLCLVVKMPPNAPEIADSVLIDRQDIC